MLNRNYTVFKRNNKELVEIKLNQSEIKLLNEIESFKNLESFEQDINICLNRF